MNNIFPDPTKSRNKGTRRSQGLLSRQEVLKGFITTPFPLIFWAAFFIDIAIALQPGDFISTVI